LIAVLGVASPRLLLADQTRIPSIGILAPAPLETALRDALQDFGYVEGKNISIRPARFGDSIQALQGYATELKSDVDVIVAIGSPAARAAMSATTIIPVIFASGNPVAAGFAQTLARPGHNGTGVSVFPYEMYAKCFEFLRQVVSRARRIATIGNPSNPVSRQVDDVGRAAVHTIGVQIAEIKANNVNELKAALHEISRKTADAVIVSGEVFSLDHKRELAESISRAGLPSCFAYREYHEERVLMTYGPSIKDMMRYGASYVPKVLGGAKPGELPVEQLSKYELIVDLRIADL